MAHFNNSINTLFSVLKTYKSRKESSRYLGINVNGNKKLRNSEKVRFMIWSLPAVITCPYATAECIKKCYAKKAEIAYPNVLKSRNRNLEMSKSQDFILNMIFTIETELATSKYNGKKVVFRIHESGDFYSKEYAMAWLEVAKHFTNRVTFMAYTKSLVFFKGEEIPENMVIRASVWSDTDKSQLALIEEMDLPIYTAVEKGFNFQVNGFSKCRCDDCATCGMCWNKSVRKNACVIH